MNLKVWIHESQEHEDVKLNTKMTMNLNTTWNLSTMTWNWTRWHEAERTDMKLSAMTRISEHTDSKFGLSHTLDLRLGYKPPTNKQIYKRTYLPLLLFPRPSKPALRKPLTLSTVMYTRQENDQRRQWTTQTTWRRRPKEASVGGQILLRSRQGMGWWQWRTW